MGNFSGKTVSYENFLSKKLKTCDIVLFCGNGIFSTAVQLLTLSRWSHIGLIIKIEKNNPILNGRKKDPDDLYLWHSINESICKIPDLMSGKEKTGVQLNSMSQIMKRYIQLGGTVYFRRMKDVVRNQKKFKSYINDGYATNKFIKFLKSQSPKLYEENILELIKCAYDWPLPFEANISDESSFFCSELVAFTLMEIGLLDKKGPPANEYSPHDFSSECRVYSESENVFYDNELATLNQSPVESLS
jgi:hypothetical protein